MIGVRCDEHDSIDAFNSLEKFVGAETLIIELVPKGTNLRPITLKIGRQT